MEETLKREQSRQLPREVLPPQSNRVLAVSGSSVMTHPLLIQLLSSLVTFFKLILLLNFYYFMNRKKIPGSAHQQESLLPVANAVCCSAARTDGLRIDGASEDPS